MRYNYNYTGVSVLFQLISLICTSVVIYVTYLSGLTTRLRGPPKKDDDPTPGVEHFPREGGYIILSAVFLCQSL